MIIAMFNGIQVWKFLLGKLYLWLCFAKAKEKNLKESNNF